MGSLRSEEANREIGGSGLEGGAVGVFRRGSVACGEKKFEGLRPMCVGVTMMWIEAVN